MAAMMHSTSLTSLLMLLVFPLVWAAFPPSIDPFYRPDADFASKPPGTVLRTRQVFAGLLTLVPVPVEAHQVLYRTRSVNGSAIATVTTIFKPQNASPDRFISFQTAEDSAYVDCAPSYNFQLGALPNNAIIQYETLLIIQAYLASGYIVSSPDHEGPDAAFTAGRLEGYAVLDSMRAASSFLKVSRPAIVGAGYSGGAIATGWAAALQGGYAPELNVKGWTIGGTPANLTGTLVFADGTVFSGFLPIAVAGLNKPSSYRDELNPLLSRIIQPYGQLSLNNANTQCVITPLLQFAGQRVLAPYFQTLGPALLANPTIISVLGQNLLGANASETPIAPVLLYHATSDEIIPYLNASTLYRSWCNSGASVHFTTYLSGGHLTTELVGLPPALAFASAAFAQSLPRGCSAETVANPSVNPAAAALNLEPVLIEVVNKLIELGPNDTNLIAAVVNRAGLPVSVV